jgi:1-acyl-sn-glycerol-3-phosphate acyltransferase
MRSLTTASRLVVLGAAYALLVGPQLLALRFSWPIRDRIPLAFHRLFLRLFNVRVVERGRRPGLAEATLVLANHVSWLDIPVIASLHSVSFVARSDVAGWPAVGLLARLQRSVFIDRRRRSATAETNAEIAHRLARGEAIVLFAEGTTSDGNRVLPFRSSLVGAARAALADPEVAHIHLQPLAITYTRRNGLPITRRERPHICWYGDMDLVPHLALFAREGPLDAVVTWGEPTRFAGNRKQAAAAAEATVRDAIRQLRAGPAPGPRATPEDPDRPCGGGSRWRHSRRAARA